MKTKSSLALLALLLLAGCGTEKWDNEEVTPANGIAIRIGQRVQGMTRAAIMDGSDVTATILMCDGADPTNWSSFTKVDKNVLDGSQNLTKRATLSAATFKAGSAQGISLNPTLYYNTDNSTSSFLAAVSPAGILTGTSVAFSMKDGLQDVMYAGAINAGNSASPVSSVDLAFEHRTTQLCFAVGVKNADSNGQWAGKSVSLKSITVQQVTLPQSVDASNGNVTWTSPAADLLVSGISTTVLSETVTAIGSPVMVGPSHKVVLNVVIAVDGVDVLFNNVTVKNPSATDLQTEEGKSHLITLTIEEPKTPTGATLINTTATVKNWEIGTAGNATLN